MRRLTRLAQLVDLGNEAARIEVSSTETTGAAIVSRSLSLAYLAVSRFRSRVSLLRQVCSSGILSKTAPLPCKR